MRFGYIVFKLLQFIQKESVINPKQFFNTIAESLDIPAYALKSLLHHKMQNDVTAWKMTDVERLRKPMQQITDYILTDYS